MKIEKRKISELIRAEYNPRKISVVQLQELKDGIEEFGLVSPLVVNENPERKNVIVGGHQRLKLWEELGNTEVDCSIVNLPLDKERKLNIKLNKNGGTFDDDLLKEFFDYEELIEWGFTATELFDMDEKEIKDNDENKKLSDTFVIPPFSIFDTKQGYWQDRKKWWNNLIGDKGESREDKLSNLNNMPAMYRPNMATVSILDPVIAEISNRWFGLDKCNTFDCFAGDSVFGYVSDYLGNKFIGIELRQEQADLNNKRLKGSKSKYICDDGQNVLKHIKPNTQDLLFSCPPYFDLEIYSDLENDASNQKEYKSFLNILDKSFTDSIKCLKDNRFAFIVVGDLRNKNGGYYNFPNDVKNIFIKNGMILYNEIILADPLGTAPARARKYMGNRKVVKVHQNIVVFYKGDTKEIKNIYPKLDLIIDESSNL